MRMKTKIFILLALASFLLTSCHCFDNPANAERIGSGHIQYEKGIYFVEINSIRYVPDKIYANTSSRDGKNRTEAVEGMLVTCFRLHGNPQVEFIIGDRSKEYLEDYFTTNSTLIIIFGIIILLFAITIFWPTPKRKIAHTD